MRSVLNFPLLCTLTVVLLAGSQIAEATGWPQKADNGFVKVYYSSATASSYFGGDGTVITQHRLEDPNDSTRQYMRFDYDIQVFGVYGEFGLSDNLTLVADFPLVALSLTETTETLRSYPSQGVTLSSTSDTTLDIAAFAYYGLGVRYALPLQGDLNVLGLLDVRIPPGFHNGLYDDPEFEYLSDGVFAMRIGAELGLPVSGGWLATRIAYALNAEERSDELHVCLEGGLNTVENAQIKLFVDGILALEDPETSRPFNVRETPSVEQYIVTGGSFIFNFSEALFADFTISAPLAGANTWNGAAVSFGIGLKFDVDADAGE